MTTMSRRQPPTKRNDEPRIGLKLAELGQSMKITRLALIAAATVAATAVAAMIGAAVTAPGAAAATCPAGGPGPPPGAYHSQRPIASLDGQGQPDTLWIDIVPNPGGGARRLVGITTASGSELGPVEPPSASPLPLQAVVVDAENNGDHQLIVSDGRAVFLYAISGCRIQTVIDQAGACLALAQCQTGAPFMFDLGNRAGNGDGVGCSDLGDGRHLVALLAQQQGGQWTVRRTEIDLDGTTATIGRSDTVTANSAHDPAVTSAQTISCGELTIDKDGVS
jgi:hypothetical protein